MDTQAGTVGKAVVGDKNCVVEAAIEVFASTCGVALSVQPDDAGESDGAVLLSVISIVGDVDWSIFLCLPEATAVECVARFAGFDIPFDSEDMGDAVGEVTNILAGQIKAFLDKQGVEADISLPSVMRAASMEVLIRRDGKTIKTCFDSEIGKLWTGVVAAG